jgi:hypothetical protein
VGLLLKEGKNFYVFIGKYNFFYSRPVLKPIFIHPKKVAAVLQLELLVDI